MLQTRPDDETLPAKFDKAGEQSFVAEDREGTAPEAASEGEAAPSRERKFDPILADLLSRSTPHRLVVALLCLSGLTPAEIASDYKSKRLTEALADAEEFLAKQNWIGDPSLPQWCATARVRLGEQIQNVFDPRSAAFRRFPKREHTKLVGETLLSNYIASDAADQAGDIFFLYQEITDIGLVAAARSGFRAAFDTLRSRYERAMEGRIKTHEHGQKNFEDVNRKLWYLAWRELPEYNPSARSVAGFFRHLADLLCFYGPSCINK
jgi:DNA-directed RNA polymerase specialized sigma24 family protein